MGKFAPITSKLLVRKGSAEPSVMSGVVKQTLYWPDEKTRDKAAEKGLNGASRPRDLRFDPPPAERMAEPRAPEHRDWHMPPPARVPAPPPNWPGHANGPAGSHANARAANSDNAGRQHKITLHLSAQEHEALAIAAVKKDVAKHQLLHEALTKLLDSLAREYGRCACIKDGSACDMACKH